MLQTFISLSLVSHRFSIDFQKFLLITISFRWFGPLSSVCLVSEPLVSKQASVIDSKAP